MENVTYWATAAYLVFILGSVFWVSKEIKKIHKMLSDLDQR